MHWSSTQLLQPRGEKIHAEDKWSNLRKVYFSWEGLNKFNEARLGRALEPSSAVSCLFRYRLQVVHTTAVQVSSRAHRLCHDSSSASPKAWGRVPAIPRKASTHFPQAETHQHTNYLFIAVTSCCWNRRGLFYIHKSSPFWIGGNSIRFTYKIYTVFYDRGNKPS